MKRAIVFGIGVAAICMIGQLARAADHTDGPRASADPSADITDVFSWMSADAKKVYLVMDLVRNASAGSKFSNTVQYVLHTQSRPAFGGAAAPDVNVICTFNAAQQVQCWAGDEAYVSGDANTTAGITSADGKLKVFAGLRNDPFFFNLRGFRQTSRIVAGAAPSLSFDAAMCPALDSATSNALVTQLTKAPDGTAGLDDFSRFNVLAIVVAVDKGVLTKGGPILSVWGSTNRS